MYKVYRPFNFKYELILVGYLLQYISFHDILIINPIIRVKKCIIFCFRVEWKRLRNKYLNLQKLKMQQLKQHLRQYQWGEQHTPKWYSHNHYEEENEKIETNQNNKEQKKGLQYTPGVIIKVILDEPVIDVKGMKVKIIISNHKNVHNSHAL